MRRTLLGISAGFGIVILLAVIGLLVAPFFIDANNYKGQITDEVRNLTGRSLEIRGDLSLRLLPSPSVSAEGISFENMPGGSRPDMLSMESARVKLAWVPLLSGTIAVSNIDLIKPDILLESYPDGRANWNIALGDEPAETAPDTQPAQTPTPDAQDEASGGMDISVGGLTIVDGVVRYIDHGTETTYAAENINVDFSMGSLKGPYAFDGAVSYQGLPVNVSGQMNAPANDGTAPISLSLGLGDAKSLLNVSGIAAIGSEVPGFNGTVLVDVQNPSTVIADVFAALGQQSPALPIALNSPLTAQARINASAEAMAIDELRLNAGSSELTGGAQVGLGDQITFQSTVHATRVDLDPWLTSGTTSSAVAAPTGAAPTGATSSPQPSTSSAEGGATEAGFAFPPNIHGTVSLKIDALTYNDAAIRDAILNATLYQGTLTITESSAQLPGASSVAMNGTVGAKNGQPSLNIGLGARSDDLRGLLKWLGVDVSQVPQDRLRSAAFSGTVSGTQDDIKLASNALSLDVTKGSVSASYRAGPRPGLGLTVRLDALNADAYLPPQATQGATGTTAAPATPATNAPGAATNGKDTALLAGLGALNDFDASFDLQLGSLTLMRETFQKVAAKGSLRGGVLRLESPTGIGQGQAGTSLAITGALKGFGGAPVFENTSLAVSAPNVQTLFKLAGQTAPDGLPTDAIRVAANLSGQLDALGVGARVDLGQLAATATGTLGNVMAGLPSALTFDVDVSHPDFQRLMRMMSPSFSAAGPLGAVKVKGQVTANLQNNQPTRVAVRGLNANVGANTLAGDVDVDMTGAKPVIKGTINAGALNIDAFLPGKTGSTATTSGGSTGGTRTASTQRWSTDPLPLDSLSSANADLTLSAKSLTVSGFILNSVNTRVTLQDGVLTIPSLTSSIYGGALGASAQVNGVGTPSMALNVDADKVSLGSYLAGGGPSHAMGTAAFKMAIQAQGASVSGMVNSLAGSGSIGLHNVDVSLLKTTNDTPLKGLLDVLGKLGEVGKLGGINSNPVNVDGQFQISAGNVTLSPPLSLTSALFNGTMGGTANLPAWTMDLSGNVQFEGGILARLPIKLPDNVPLGLKGPIDRPNVTVGTGSLATSGVRGLVDEKLGEKLEKAVPGASGVLDSVIGGGNSPDGTKPNTEDAVRGLLRGLRK